MTERRVRLFGRFEVDGPAGAGGGLESGKAAELLCSLLVTGRCPVRREALAARLWPEVDTGRSRKYLRHALWRLQKACDGADPGRAPLLVVDQEWVQLRQDAGLWVDAFELEAAHDGMLTAGDRLPASARDRALRAVDLYRGPLLEGPGTTSGAVTPGTPTGPCT
nr:hypothetical protein GCM10020241_54330 [Streptoalloteichus tenebrarius]